MLTPSKAYSLTSQMTDKRPVYNTSLSTYRRRRRQSRQNGITIANNTGMAHKSPGCQCRGRACQRPAEPLGIRLSQYCSAGKNVLIRARARLQAQLLCSQWLLTAGSVRGTYRRPTENTADISSPAATLTLSRRPRHLLAERCV